MNTEDYNTDEYKQGWNDWEKHVKSGFSIPFHNPYKKGTKEFLLYRKGWNSNFSGIN